MTPREIICTVMCNNIILIIRHFSFIKIIFKMVMLPKTISIQLGLTNIPCTRTYIVGFKTKPGSNVIL